MPIENVLWKVAGDVREQAEPEVLADLSWVLHDVEDEQVGHGLDEVDVPYFVLRQVEFVDAEVFLANSHAFDRVPRSVKLRQVGKSGEQVVGGAKEVPADVEVREMIASVRLDCERGDRVVRKIQPDQLQQMAGEGEALQVALVQVEFEQLPEAGAAEESLVGIEHGQYPRAAREDDFAL